MKFSFCGLCPNMYFAPGRDYEQMLTMPRSVGFNPLNSELNPIYHLLALVGAHHIFHFSRVRVKYGFETCNRMRNMQKGTIYGL